MNFGDAAGQMMAENRAAAERREQKTPPSRGKAAFCYIHDT
jgi:hypothetical protein